MCISQTNIEIDREMMGKVKLITDCSTPTPQFALIAGVLREEASHGILIYIVFPVAARCAHIKSFIT